MNRTFQLSLFAVCIASPLASVDALAQTDPASSLTPIPWAAPVGHRQPTASGLAPAAAPVDVTTFQSGRSVGRGARYSDDNLIQTPRICTNCDD